MHGGGVDRVSTVRSHEQIKWSRFFESPLHMLIGASNNMPYSSIKINVKYTDDCMHAQERAYNKNYLFAENSKTNFLSFPSKKTFDPRKL